MANSFISTFQNLANSFSSATNCFTWDSAIRKFQYAIAGITLGALAIFETTNKMQCSVKSQNFPEYYFASSYCFESTWYHISEDGNSTKIKYDENLRYFKWYILLPPLMTIILSVLYGAIVNGFLVQSIRAARSIMDLQNVKTEDLSPSTGSNAIDKTIQSMAMQTRHFSEMNLLSKQGKSLWPSFISGTLTKRSVSTRYGATEDGDQTELVQISCHNADGVKFVDTGSSLGGNTSIWYNLYLFLCLAINGVAVGFINPYFFWLPNAIACHYRKEDLSYHWSICSVPGYRYFRVAVIVVMLNHAVGAIVALLSFLYLNVFIPREIRGASAVISAYTRDPKQQDELGKWWKKYGREKVDSLTATSRFLLALVYQNIDRTLCFRLVLALADIDIDREAVESQFPLLIKEIARIDMEEPATMNDLKEDMITEIRDTIMDPVGIDQAKASIQRISIDLLHTYLNNPQAISVLFQAQLIHRITGVHVSKLSGEIKSEFVTMIEEQKEKDFENPVIYSRFLSAVYDLSKMREFFTLLEPTEIGHLIGAETTDHISDNGHEIVAGQHYDGRKAFDTSGYCWRSSDATAYNWIRRAWDQDHVINLIAIQGSHVNPKSTPVRFNFTAKLEVEKSEEVSWVAVSETYRSYNWLADEWRVFPVYVVDKASSKITHPITKCIQINIFDNDGAEYFEVQKIKIYGSQI